MDQAGTGGACLTAQALRQRLAYYGRPSAPRVSKNGHPRAITRGPRSACARNLCPWFGNDPERSVLMGNATVQGQLWGMHAQDFAIYLERAGLRVEAEGGVACPFVFPSAEASWRGNASAGPNQVAIAHSGRQRFAPPSRRPTAPTRVRMGASTTRMSSSGRRANDRSGRRTRTQGRSIQPVYRWALEVAGFQLRNAALSDISGLRPQQTAGRHNPLPKLTACGCVNQPIFAVRYVALLRS